MAKGKASNIADKIKWLLSISIFSVAIVGNGYYTEVAFLYRVLAVVALFIFALVILATTVFGKAAVSLMRESRTEMRRVVWANSHGDHSNFYGCFWIYHRSLLVFLGTRISFKLVNKINFRIVIK